MPKGIKKQPVKRKYTKRSKEIKIPEDKIQKALDDWHSAVPKKQIDEIEFLDAVVTGVEDMDNDQKSRFINYIYSRYSRFITISKLTQ